MVGAVILRKVAIALIAFQVLGLSQSYATTATPKPIPKVTSTKKAVPKKKVVTKKTTAPKKKVAVKKKVVVHHYIYHKRVLKPVPPSPSPTWPPKGFTSFGFAYARIPTGAELVGILSAVKNPDATINVCATDPKHPKTPADSCGAILVATSQKCTFWNITSTVTGVDPADSKIRVSLGTISTYAVGAASKKIQTIFLISPIPLQTGVKFTLIHAVCGAGAATVPVPSTTFVPTPIASESAAPLESASPTATPTPTPSPVPTP